MANHFTKAGDYYVSALGGNDSNAGTDPSAPMKTIAAATAAAAAAGASGTVIVGSGIYVERIVATNVSDEITIQGDGNVIIDGTGQASSIYQGRYWIYKDLIFVNSSALYTGNASYAFESFESCKFKNILLSTTLIMSQNLGTTFSNCIFDNMNSNYYWRYITLNKCTFINSRPFSLGGADGSGLSTSYNNCMFYMTSGSVVLSNRYFTGYAPYLTDCVFSPNLEIYGNDQSAYTTKFTITQEYLDNNTAGITNCTVASMSFNDNVTGSGAFNLIENTMPLNATTKELYSKGNLIAALNSVGGYAPRTAYADDASSANPLHTDGGATWDNIMTGSLGGFQISSSTAPSGTITTAVIDQGNSRTVKSIGSAWTTTALNAAAPSTYPSGSNNHNPTRYQYEMRWGNSTPSGDYSIFEFDTTPYVNSNGTGSGDQLFDTGSNNYTNVSGRYLQLRITLRNDMSGSA